jgi:alpha-D-xyloside xylohydrolase
MVEGGRFFTDQCDFLSIPLWIRPNSIVALGARDDRPDYEYGEDVRLIITHLEKGAKAQTQIVNLQGQVVANVWAEWVGEEIRVSADGPISYTLDNRA